MSRVLNALALTACAVATLATVWIIFPAPSYNFWLLSVLASEWSLAFGALGAFGILCGLLARVGDGGRVWLVSTISGGLAVLLSLYPLGAGLQAAREHGVSLSLRQYVSGSVSEAAAGASENAAGSFSTYTFMNAGGSALQLDAYLPPVEVETNGAGVVVVHGGSWNASARSDFPQWNRWLTRQGFAVFDVDYRLAPQPNWQTATGDVKCAVMWVKRHAAEFRVSPDRLVLLGRSAGGQLALLAAYTADDARLPSSCPRAADLDEPAPGDSPGADVRAVVSFYGPTDLLWAYDNPGNRRVIDGPTILRRFVGGDPHASNETRELFRLASPVAHVTPRTPPTLLIHGGLDQLVRSENMELLGGKLKEAGVPFRLVLIPYAQHGFDYNFNGWGAQIVQRVLLDFLRENTSRR
jgi:acetyl esterase/lipase